MEWQGIRITDGTGQRDRAVAAFQAGSFDVDEQNFEQLLAMGAEIATRIRYYNLDNAEAGNWGDLFYADEAVIMATILSTDTERLEKDYRGIAYHRIDLVTGFLLDLVAQIDFWHRRLFASKHDTGHLMAHKLGNLIEEKLLSQLHDLGRIVELADLEPAVEFRDFGDIWKVGDLDGPNPFPESEIEFLPAEGEIKRRLSTCFYAIANAIGYLQNAAEPLLRQSLTSQQHEPATGLFIVFLQLLKSAQRRLNRFTLRHLDFYYRDVLKGNNRGPLADSRYLLLEASANAAKRRIDRDTGFSAGKDVNLNDIVYRADQSIVLNNIRVGSLATLHLQFDPMNSPEAGLGYVSRIKSAQPPIDLDPDVEAATGWALFGAAGSASGISVDADIGFAVASPLLSLQQGQREIELAFELEPLDGRDSEERLEHLMQAETRDDFLSRLGGFFALYLLRFGGGIGEGDKAELIDKAIKRLQEFEAQEIRSLLRQDWQGLFYKLFKQPFRLQLTTAEGWLDIEETFLLPLDEDETSKRNGIRLVLKLDAAQPPIEAYRAEVHGGQLATELPVLRCQLNSQAHFCVYSVFRNLTLATLDIDVSVSGIRDLQVHNQNGRLDPTSPFQPFGPLPGTGSYLVFGNHEMARKPLREVTVELDWNDLPAGAGGFDEHYSAYTSDMGNKSFEVSFSMLADGNWLPADAAVRACFKLFQSGQPGNRVAVQTTFRFDELSYMKPIGPGVAEEDYRYDLQSRDGFFRLSLVSPANAFGHGDYTRLLTAVLTANTKKKKPDPVPNPPYTPVVGGMTMAYRAASSIRPAIDVGSAERLFHLHPFGVERVHPPVPEQHCFLLPQYEHEGNLFIGLRGDDIGGPLSLLFHLAHDRVAPLDTERAEFEWYYLHDNRWLPLSKRRILADHTHEFIASGTVTVDLPDDFDRESSIMPAGYCWLRIAITRGAAAVSNCYRVKPNAIRVRRQLGASDAGAEPAADNDWAPLDNADGIAAVSQALVADGGRAAETDSAFRVRVSERLRHKNRAMLPRDYEQLVLEAFPELAKVKCFNSFSRADEAVKPGHVLLVAVPRVDERAGEACRRARVDARRLQQIREFVRQHCPAFVNLEVINPTYEQIQVRCTVRFNDAPSEGTNLDRLNRQISDYLCPWRQPGYEARFGWSIRQRDIEAYILSLGYIDFVTNFSMLHISVDQQGLYRLGDTAAGERNREAVIEPRYPWSLAIPMAHHAIEITRQARAESAEITGVGELEVGGTFILGNSEYGEER